MVRLLLWLGLKTLGKGLGMKEISWDASFSERAMNSSSVDMRLKSPLMIVCKPFGGMWFTKKDLLAGAMTPFSGELCGK